MERCTACSYARTSRQVVFGEGNEKARIVCVGEGPGPNEDETGRPFIGRAGQLLTKFLEEVGIDRKWIWITNVFKCFPGRDKDGSINKPDPANCETCSSIFLFPELKVIRPAVILAFGLTATRALLKTDSPMADLIGKEFETEWGLVLPLYHPSYFLYHSEDFTKRRQVLDRLVRARHLAGLGEIGKAVEQVKVEKHQSDSRVIAELERKSGVFEHHPWNDNREYMTAWTDARNVVLVFKDKDGFKRHEAIPNFDWYFYLKTKDVLKLGEKFWSRWLADEIVTHFEVDEVNPYWTQVYANRQVTRTRSLREHLLEANINLYDPRQTARFEHDRTLRELLDEIERHDVEHYEADLTPMKRFMTDWDLKLASEFNELYFDIETDDTVPGFDRQINEQKRILSIAWEMIYADKTRRADSGFLLLSKETDGAEKKLLEEFAHVLDRADVLYAWNGNNFDFPITRARMFQRRVFPRWDLLHAIDLLRVWHRYFQRGASVNTSFALQNIAWHVLKQKKVDWKANAAARGLKLKKFIDLYRQAPDILEAYNRDDCHKMVELEAFTGFAKIEQVFCRVGNCFTKDYHITTKIDSLLLKRGKQVGIHFPTRRTAVVENDKKRREAHYEGAYVLEPRIGLYENVCALDFKSLYPSVMVAWNISPETYVSPAKVSEFPEEKIIQCPTGAYFRHDRIGFVPEVFADTLEKRKVYTGLQQNEPVGSDKFLLYYRLAYSFKRLGLSFYGDMGNVESRFYNPAVAEAVTLSAQYILKKTIEIAEEVGFAPLYGDTDSLYIQMPRRDGLAFVEHVNRVLRKHLAEKFAVPEERFIVELEYENFFERIFFVRKKRYAGLMAMYKGKDASYTEIKGFECMRSDGIEYSRQMQRTVIEMIVRERRTQKELIAFIFDQQRKVLKDEFALEEITITKGVSKRLDDYKARAAHVRVAEAMKKSGEEFFVGMKVPYIVVERKPRIQAVWAEEFSGEFDRLYYWDKLIYPPSARILKAVYPNISWDLLFLRDRPKPRKDGENASRRTRANPDGAAGKDSSEEVSTNARRSSRVSVRTESNS